MPNPRKSLGQHYLIDLAYADRIVEAAALTPDDVVLEIGPGPGVLTGRLADRAGRVVAVEIDARQIDLLRTQIAGQPNLSLVHGDILEEKPAQLVARDGVTPAYKVVANLPYYITSHVLRHLLESDPPPALCVLMVQKEVALRICAVPGDLSVLGVSVQFYSEPELLFTVPPAAFRPAPKVESAVVRLVTRPQHAVSGVTPEHFFRTVRAAFGQKRKQLANSLSSGLALPKEEVAAQLRLAGIDPARRAETLSLEEWGAITRQFD